MEKGKLYIVATPIGHLGDMSFRGVEVLKSVAFILAEDTRESKKLLDRYDIPVQLVSYRDQNHDRMIAKIIEKLSMGLDLALISDCGTPLISDPGFKVVRDLREQGYEIIPIPGASAVIAGLSASGLPTDKFLFLGFLPKSEIRRARLLLSYKGLKCTLVIYESPMRLTRLLTLLEKIFVDSKVCVAKDITKMREEFTYGTVTEVIAKYKAMDFDAHPHGEFVVMLENSED